MASADVWFLAGIGMVFIIIFVTYNILIDN